VSASENIQFTVSGNTATIRLCAPDRSNAFTTLMMRELAEAITAANQAGAALIVLEGQGSDFSTGRVQGEQGVSLRESLEQAIAVNHAWRTAEAVTLTVVEGAALGFAFGLVAQSDLAIASADARFAFDEMAHGFVPKIVLSYLPERLPRSLALDLVLSARSITGEQALSLGLVTRTAPPGELRGAALDYARTLVDDGRAALLRDAKAYAERVMAEPPAARPSVALEESLRSMAPSGTT